MKLFYHPLSGNSRRVLLTVAHLQLPIERILVDLTRREQKAEPHLARNPNGRVPVLEDDGFLLWESRAIMIYLCEKTPGQTLLPTDARGKAACSGSRIGRLAKDGARAHRLIQPSTASPCSPHSAPSS